MDGPIADGKKAHDALLSFAPLANKGLCWHYVWQAYKSAGAATSQGSTPTAYAAWNQTSGKHYDRNPPEGAAIWLGRRTSDGNMDGDVFIAGAYDGDHAATDYPSWYGVGRCTIQQRINQTGREYLGWSDHILDCPINLGDDDMGTIDNNEQNYQTIAGFLARALKWDVRNSGTVPPSDSDASKYGPTIWDTLGAINNKISAINVDADVDEKKLATELVAQGIQVVIIQKP